jgi:hypothetical protein
LDRQSFETKREKSLTNHTNSMGSKKVATCAKHAHNRAATPTIPEGRMPDEGSHRMELWKQVIITLGAIVVAVIGAWSAIRTSANSRPDPVVPAAPAVAVDSTPDPVFVGMYVYRPDEIRRIEYEMEQVEQAGALTRRTTPFLRVTRVAFGHVEGDPAFSVRLLLTNISPGPVTLGLNRRFFSLADGRGRAATLVHFCCDATGTVLGPGQTREISLLFRAPPGWFAKDGAPDLVYVRVHGLLPLVRAAWSVPPLKTAA